MIIIGRLGYAPVARRETLSSLVYLSTMSWMLLSRKRDSTARPGLPVLEPFSVRTLAVEGEETWRSATACPSTQRLIDVSEEEEDRYRLNKKAQKLTF